VFVVGDRTMKVMLEIVMTLGLAGVLTIALVCGWRGWE
jgi:hypothetical protein